MRNLTQFESAVLLKILDVYDAPKKLKDQVDGIRAQNLPDSDNYGSVVLFPLGISRAKERSRLIGGLEAFDADGVKINALLHAKHDALDELEIFKADGSPIIHMPPASQFKKEVRSE